MRKIPQNLLIGTLALVIAGCVTTPQRQIYIHKLAEPFNASDVAWSSKVGSASIKGSAVIQTRGGIPRTCAGTSVYLSPDSPYTQERMNFWYGTAGELVKGYYSASEKIRNHYKLEENANYLKFVREVFCDPAGFFEFTNLPAGTYYVVSTVQWQAVGPMPEGGSMMQKVSVKDGESKKIVMSTR